MSNVCEITGKKRLRGNRVSHANNKSIHFQLPNIQIRKIYIPELKRSITLKLTTNGLRTLDKVGGLSRFVLKKDPTQLTPELRKIRKEIIKKGLK